MFTGGYAINPVNDEKIPIWIADYVLMTYGTGAIMAVPAHDQRDFEFARQYDLEIIPVIQPEGETLDGKAMEEAWSHEGVMVNSAQFDGTLRPRDAKGMSNPAIKAVTEWLNEKDIGESAVTYRSARLADFAPALLGFTHPHGALRKLWHCACPRRPVARRTAG